MKGFGKIIKKYLELKENFKIEEMMKIKDVLTLVEKRSNSDKNMRIPAVAELEKYKNDDTIYISFTNINKFGIYPHAKDGDTPFGLYAFPLAVCWDKYNIDEVNDFRNFPDIIKSTSYIQVVKFNAKASDKFINGLSTYKPADLHADLKKLVNEFGEDEVDEAKMVTVNRKEFKKGNVEIKPFLLLYLVTCELSNNDHIKWGNLLRKIGYVGFSDIEGFGGIHSAEPYQTVFFGKHYKEEEIVSNVIDHVDGGIKFKRQLDTIETRTIANLKPKDMSVSEMLNVTRKYKVRIQKLEPYLIRKVEHPEDLITYMELTNFSSRWKDAEEMIKTDAESAALYSFRINRRFEAAEENMKNYKNLWKEYTTFFRIKRID